MKKITSGILAFALAAIMGVTFCLTAFAAGSTLEDYQAVLAEEKDYYTNVYEPYYHEYLNLVKELREEIKAAKLVDRTTANAVRDALSEITQAHRDFFGDRTTVGKSRYDVPAARQAMYNAADHEKDYDSAIAYCVELDRLVHLRVDHLKGAIAKLNELKGLVDNIKNGGVVVDAAFYYLIVDEIPADASAQPKGNYEFAGKGMITVPAKDGVADTSWSYYDTVNFVDSNITTYPEGVNENACWYVIKYDATDGWHVDGYLEKADIDSDSDSDSDPEPDPKLSAQVTAEAVNPNTSSSMSLLTQIEKGDSYKAANNIPQDVTAVYTIFNNTDEDQILTSFQVRHEDFDISEIVTDGVSCTENKVTDSVGHVKNTVVYTVSSSSSVSVVPAHGYVQILIVGCRNGNSMGYNTKQQYVNNVQCASNANKFVWYDAPVWEYAE